MWQPLLNQTRLPLTWPTSRWVMPVRRLRFSLVFCYHTFRPPTLFLLGICWQAAVCVAIHRCSHKKLKKCTQTPLSNLVHISGFFCFSVFFCLIWTPSPLLVFVFVFWFILGVPCRSVVISGNYHNPDQDSNCMQYSGVAATGAHAVMVEANDVGGCGKRKPGQVCQSLLMLHAPSNALCGICVGLVMFSAPYCTILHHTAILAPYCTILHHTALCTCICNISNGSRMNYAVACLLTCASGCRCVVYTLEPA